MSEESKSKLIAEIQEKLQSGAKMPDSIWVKMSDSIWAKMPDSFWAIKILPELPESILESIKESLK